MPPDLEEFYCDMCDTAFEARIIGGTGVEEITHCPFCGEPLDADEL